MINNYKRTIFSWSLYDFANQPFTTIILTFVYSTFFTDFIAPSGEVGAIMWGSAAAPGAAAKPALLHAAARRGGG